MIEKWRDVKGYESLYQVSNLGRVKSLRSNIIMKASHCKGKYLKVKLCINGKQKTMQVHRMVAETFIKNADNKPQVNHIDGNKENNCVNNLEWVTPKENLYHALKTGLFYIDQFIQEPKKVVQLDKNMNVINAYDSIYEAASKSGVNHSSISKVCRGVRITAGNYLWEYQ